MAQKSKGYYLPSPSSWPLKGSIALICTVVGAANWLHEMWFGPYLFGFGLLMLVYMICGWFGMVIRENRAGILANPQVDRSFRWCMCWFIFSEIMFFGAFFGALFFVRVISVPVLSGAGSHFISHVMLWPSFTAGWPAPANPNPSMFVAPKSVMEAFGIPAINTLILLTSGATITLAHWALLKDRRKTMLIGQLLTILLGMSFLYLQAHEYTIAYLQKG